MTADPNADTVIDHAPRCIRQPRVQQHISPSPAAAPLPAATPSAHGGRARAFSDGATSALCIALFLLALGMAFRVAGCYGTAHSEADRTEAAP